MITTESTQIQLDIRQMIAITPELVSRIHALIGGIDVDFNAPLDDAEDE